MAGSTRSINKENGLVNLKPPSSKRNWIEFLIEKVLLAAGGLAVIFVVLIFVYIIYEAIPFFLQVNPLDFFLGLTWRPESPSTPQYGLLPSLWGSFFVTIMALAIAIPIGVVSAMYISQVACRL
ncbi:MAG: hypothetical protein QW327_04385, partial [Candidatus Odinarchaeota archaeon]